MTPRQLRSELSYLALCFAAALVLTWPLARVFTQRLAGAPGDPHLTPWSMRWMRDLQLPELYRRDGVRIYAVPGT